MSIATEIQRLQQAKSDLAVAIEGKGVTVPSTTKIDGYPALVDAIQQGELAPQDVNFIDYDGTLLHSYTAEEFLALNALPENPTHDGLIAQGWNWTLEEAMAQVQSQGCCDIGQNYIPDDGNTHIHIVITAESPDFCLYLNSVSAATYLGATIRWGDEQTTEVSPTQTNDYHEHTYTVPGEYEIILEVPEGGSVRLGSRSSSLAYAWGDYRNGYKNKVRRVYIGNGLLLGEYANLSFMPLLEVLSLCRQTENTNVNSLVWEGLYVRGLVLPPGVTTLNSISCAPELRYLSLPPSVRTINGLEGMYNLRSFVIPDGVTYANLGAKSGALLSQKKMIIPASAINPASGSIRFSTASPIEEIDNRSPNLPITGSANMWFLKRYAGPVTRTNLIPTYIFYCCYALRRLAINNMGVDITEIGPYAFAYCYNLTQANIVGLDWTKIVSIGRCAFGNSRLDGYISLPSLTALAIESFQHSGIERVDNLGSITAIPNKTFFWCRRLTSVRLPVTVTSIGDSALEQCASLDSINLDNIISIGRYGFYRARLSDKALSLPRLTTLSSEAFQFSEIASVRSLGSITALAGNTFADCTRLTDVVLPATLQSIAASAFARCTALQRVTIEAVTPPTLTASAFSVCPLLDSIYVPAESVETYKTATNWSAFADKIKPIE